MNDKLIIGFPKFCATKSFVKIFDVAFLELTNDNNEMKSKIIIKNETLERMSNQLKKEFSFFNKKELLKMQELNNSLMDTINQSLANNTKNIVYNNKNLLLKATILNISKNLEIVLKSKSNEMNSLEM